MAFTKYTKDTKIIGALGTNPAERGLTTQEFKDKFDQFADEFVTWFNETHLPEVAEKAVVDEHKAETASQNVLGHIKIGAAGAIDANGVYTPTGFKFISASHDLSVAGAQAITGVGFTPRAVIAIGAVSGGAASIGFAENSGSVYAGVIASNYGAASSWIKEGCYLIDIYTGSGVVTQASIISYDSDGITLDWVKTGAPTGTVYFNLLCIK